MLEKMLSGSKSARYKQTIDIGRVSPIFETVLEDSYFVNLNKSNGLTAMEKKTILRSSSSVLLDSVNREELPDIRGRTIQNKLKDSHF